MASKGFINERRLIYTCAKSTMLISLGGVIGICGAVHVNLNTLYEYNENLRRILIDLVNEDLEKLRPSNCVQHDGYWWDFDDLGYQMRLWMLDKLIMQTK